MPQQLVGHNREKQARAEDRLRATAVLLKNRVERSEIARQIAERFGCGSATVRRDILRLINRWREESRATIEEWKARELAELDDMEFRTIRGFDEATASASASLNTILSSLRAMGQEGFPEKPLKSVLTSIQAIVDDDASAGELRALWIYRRLQVKEHRAKILGLFAPTKVAPTMPDGEHPWTPEGLTDDERVARLRALLEVAQERLARGGKVTPVAPSPDEGAGE